MGQRIQQYWGEIKGLADQSLGEWGIFAIVVLVGLISFGLGRLSALQEARPAVSIRNEVQLASPQGMYLGGLVVASKSGSAYYYPWCAGADKITPGNRVWFKSKEEAQSAGYAPAKNCKGLE